MPYLWSFFTSEPNFRGHAFYPQASHTPKMMSTGFGFSPSPSLSHLAFQRSCNQDESTNCQRLIVLAYAPEPCLCPCDPRWPGSLEWSTLLPPSSTQGTKQNKLRSTNRRRKNNTPKKKEKKRGGGGGEIITGGDPPPPKKKGKLTAGEKHNPRNKRKRAKTAL